MHIIPEKSCETFELWGQKASTVQQISIQSLSFNNKMEYIYQTDKTWNIYKQQEQNCAKWSSATT